MNLLIFTAGRILREVGADHSRTALPSRPAPTANPLPQALILTAIVISFSFFAFLLVLAYRAYQELGNDDTDGDARCRAESRGPAADGILSAMADRAGDGAIRGG